LGLDDGPARTDTVYHARQHGIGGSEVADRGGGVAQADRLRRLAHLSRRRDSAASASLAARRTGFSGSLSAALRRAEAARLSPRAPSARPAVSRVTGSMSSSRQAKAA